jgi:PHP family Zn ribbon phosphoesterase
VLPQDLRSGNTKSCGCISRQNMKAFYTHTICRQCGTTYKTNKYKQSRNLCGVCNHRLSSRLYARRRVLAKRETTNTK